MMAAKVAWGPNNVYSTILVAVVLLLGVVTLLVLAGRAYNKATRLVAFEDAAFASGPVVLARVLSCTAGHVNAHADDVSITCDLEVAVADATDYRAGPFPPWLLPGYRVDVPVHLMGMFRPGLEIRAKAHRDDRTRLRFLWDELSRAPS